MLKKFWSIWRKAMGDDLMCDDIECHIGAIIRTFFWIINIITCGFIMANCIRHWNS